MPLQRLEFVPGVNREGTNYSNKGGYFASDKVRFMGGLPQKIGGWQNITSGSSEYKGVARALWNYISLASQNLLGVGTNQKIYIEFGGTYHDITPILSTVTLGANPIATTSGSKLVTITATAHGTSVGSFVTISGATAVGGITLSGEYEIVGVPSANTYTVIASSAASSTASGGGASVQAEYQILAGPPVATSDIGWGAGPWGSGGWGSSSPQGISMRLWKISNYGDDALFAFREGDIYYWAIDTSTWGRAVTLTTKANSLTKTSTYSTYATGATTIVVDDATGINTGSVIAGSGIPAGTYVTTSWTGTTSLTLSAAATSSGTVSLVTASYAGRHAPNEVLGIIFSPVNNFLIALGSKPYNPTNFSTSFDPLLVRWSDQDNPFEWVPEITNQAGEQRLSSGSYIVTGTSTRQEIVLFTDTSIYSMQYVGPPFVWSFNLLDHDISVAAPNAVTSANNAVFWMGEDKFFVYDGTVKPLPCTVRQYVFSSLNKNQMQQIMSGFNEAFSEVWWFYPSSDSSVNNRYVAFNFQEGVWHYGSLNRTAYAPHSMRSYPMLANGIQESYLSAAIDSDDTTITLLNGSSYPQSGTLVIDSEEITYTGVSSNTLTGCVRGANSTTAASHTIYTSVTLKAPNQVMFHEVGTDDLETGTPQPIEAYIDTCDIDIGDGERFSFVSKFIPDVKFANSTAASPSVSLMLFPRRTPGAAYDTNSSNTVTAAAVLPVEQYTEQLWVRVRGRQLALRLSSSGLGVAWQMGVMRMEIRPDGRR